MKKQILVMLLAACVFSAAKAEEQTVDCGKTVKITATAKEGYQFVKWIDGATLEEVSTDAVLIFENVDEAKNLKAVFSKVYVLNITAQEGGSVALVDGEELKPIPADLELLDGDKITVQASIDDDCYEFIGWSDGETEMTRTITASSSLTELNIVAQFALKTFKFTVSSDDDDMGTVSFSYVTEDNND